MKRIRNDKVNGSGFGMANRWSRFLTAEADSEWQIDGADSSPLKRIRNDKVVEHSSWPLINIGFFAVSTSANSVGGRGRPPHAAPRRCERALR